MTSFSKYQMKKEFLENENSNNETKVSIANIRT